MQKLTQAEVARQRAPGRYPDGHGLSLIVVTPERRHWQYRFMRQGKDRVMSLGNADLITLAGARALHLKARAMLAQGIDPLDERHQAKASAEPPKPPSAPPFAEAARAYIAAYEPSWKSPVHRQQWRSTIAEACAVIGDKPVDQIGTAAVLAVLEPIWHAKPETASRLRGRIEIVLDYAKAKGWREGDNPARWRGHLKLMLPSPTKLKPVQHHAALDWRECPAFMARLLPLQGSMGALALAFAILTAARSGEVREATWHEVDLDAALWTVPGARMKGGRAHRVPLSQAALDLLRPLAEARQGALIFPSPASTQAPLSNMTLTAVLKRMGRGDLTAHGFRSSFRDWCSDTGRSADAAEAALAHAPASKVIAAYARSDLLEARRGLMAEWAAFLTQPPEAKVVPLFQAVA